MDSAIDVCVSPLSCKPACLWGLRFPWRPTGSLGDLCPLPGVFSEGSGLGFFSDHTCNTQTQACEEAKKHCVMINTDMARAIAWLKVCIIFCTDVFFFCFFFSQRPSFMTISDMHKVNDTTVDVCSCVKYQIPLSYWKSFVKCWIC